jgi:hypothetical protein
LAIGNLFSLVDDTNKQVCAKKKARDRECKRNNGRERKTETTKLTTREEIKRLISQTYTYFCYHTTLI